MFVFENIQSYFDLLFKIPYETLYAEIFEIRSTTKCIESTAKWVKIGYNSTRTSSLPWLDNHCFLERL